MHGQDKAEELGAELNPEMFLQQFFPMRMMPYPVKRDGAPRSAARGQRASDIPLPSIPHAV
jgi:hypothetical protein